MTITIKKVLLAGLASAAIGTLGQAHAQSLLEQYREVSQQGRSTYALDIDNDSLLLKRDDGLYTSGLKISRQTSLADAAKTTSFGWHFGQELYTASDINLPPSRIGPPDHPYAGWLFGGVYRQIDRADGSSNRYGVDIGCLGPCAGGEWTQNRLHRLLDQPLPQGWDKQVKNEAGVVLHARVAPMRWAPTPGIDVTPVLHARFGNIFTDAGVGVTLRAGRLNIMPQQPTLHAYLRLDARAVAYNATLQGGYFSNNNPHVTKPKRVAGEAEAGVLWRQNRFGMSAALVRRANEIDGLSNATGAQNFLRVQFSYTP